MSNNIPDPWSYIIEEENLDRFLQLFLRENPLTSEFDLFDYVSLNNVKLSREGDLRKIFISGKFKDNEKEFGLFVKTTDMENVGEMTWNTISDELNLKSKGMKKFNIS